MEYRSATEADLEGEFAVFRAAQQELHDRRGAPWPAEQVYDPNGRWATVHRHLLAHDSERSFVAEDGGRIVGFTAAFVRDDYWFLSALFIDPGYQGRGLGGRLLELAWGDIPRRRITITEAIQPVSTAMYARRGLLPATPVLGFTGQATTALASVGLDASPTDPEALRAIDLAAYGFDRGVDHEFWSETSSRSTLWTRNGEPSAYSYRGLFGIGPVAGRDQDSAAEALRAELAESRGDEIRVDIPGTATALVEVALTARLKLTDPGLLLLSRGQQPPPAALAIHSYWLL